MSVIAMYGRAPQTPQNTIDYPQPVMPYRVGPPRYVQRVVSPILGLPWKQTLDADDSTLIMDPSSVYSYTQRNKGLGGLGADPAPPGQLHTFFDDFNTMAKDNKGMLIGGMIALTVAVLAVTKVFGRVAG